MKLIKTTEELSTFCDYASQFEIVTIDTEIFTGKNLLLAAMFGSNGGKG